MSGFIGPGRRIRSYYGRLGRCEGSWSRVRVYGVAEAAHAAEHRDRRGRRRDSPARRLGGGHRLCERHGGALVLHRLLLDPTPLLGAEPADEGRVREGGSADAAGRAGRGRDPPPDPALHGAPLCGHPAAVLRRRFGGIYLVGSVVLGLGFIAGAVGSTAGPTGAARCSCTCSRWPISRCCSARWPPTPIYRMRPRP